MDYYIHPDITIKAKTRNLGGAIRAWQVAKWLDIDGSGVIHKSLLNGAIKDFGISKRNRQKWVKAAYQAGFLEKLSKTTIGYRSPENVALILGLGRLCRRVIIPEPEKLFQTDYGVLVFDCLIAGLEADRITGKTISKVAIRRLYGIPESTQKHYRRQGKTRAFPNVVRLNSHYVDEGGAVRKWGSITVRQLPNTYTSPYELMPKGRTKKINRLLRELVFMGRVSQQYFHDWNKARKQETPVLCFAYNRRGTNYWHFAGGN